MARSNRVASKIDAIIGIKIHELRVVKGLSRKQLADKVDVTHQQILKYEDGSNRISAGRLSLIAYALAKPVSYFFSDLDKVEHLPTDHQRMCIEVSRNFLKIKNPKEQDAINILVRTLAEDK